MTTVNATLVGASGAFLTDFRLSSLVHVDKLLRDIFENITTQTADIQQRDTLPNVFVPTAPSSYWLPLSLGLSALLWFIFHRLYIPGITPKMLAVSNLVVVSLSVVPFLVYVATKRTWTGTNLSDVHLFLIDHFHLVLMFVWVVTSILQIITAIMKKYRTHRFLGKLGMNVLLPMIFVELYTNSMWVFFPSKSVALMQGLWLKPTKEVVWTDALVFSFPLSSALLTPAMMMMYWWLAQSSIADVDRIPSKAVRIQLHTLYSTMLIMVSIAPGWLRWMFRASFEGTGCPMYTHDIISVRVQHYATNISLMVPAVPLLYATVPLRIRLGEKGKVGAADAVIAKQLRCSFYLYTFHMMTQFFSSWVLGFPSGFRCDPDAIDELLKVMDG